MNNYILPQEFSSVFFQTKPRNFKIISEIEHTLKHPFVFLEHYKSNPINDINLHGIRIDQNSFKNSISFFNQLKSEQFNAYKHFELELSLSDEYKRDYLNEVVSILLNFRTSVHLPSKRYNNASYYGILSNVVIDILKNIFITHHLLFNDKNRATLSPMFYLTEPIKSFQLKRHIEEKKFHRLFTRLVQAEFIGFDTSFYTFKSVFEGRYLENKVNWVGNKSSLYYLIKLLIKEKAILNPKNKHWLITSQFFLLNGEPLNQGDFINQKETQQKSKRTIIEKFINSLIK